MKKLVLLVALLAFLVAAPLAMAQDKVNCCVAGKCTEGVAKADCEKQKGTAVKDCKECK
jgi:hypothetical protein